ncbi:hypothetical protein KUCAC02_001605 [Chaenocephalus aceratus]|uniref:Uncharacterized protein n=1 Tax=Chaenocephalus aceratus TaxID=36190 RepID=A0ACB9XR34_CHAAC|nr:hypothetical protein KUCAC02_001605 [Chaenocephalus aceratus]
MQAAPCAWGASIHTASLLTSLNLQREQGQFCDVVLRPKQDPGELYPAHRCVLAASSPVLASILLSTGALVELQASCLSDSVLPLLLHFIYTGDLPYFHSQHQHHNLLTAACYLQMDGLQEALKARQQTEAEAGDNANVSTGTLIKYLPEDHPYSANVGTCNDIDPCRSSSNNGTNHCSRNNTSSLRKVNTCHSISESTESSVNTGNCRQEPQDLSLSIPCIVEVLGESGDDKEVQKDQFHSGHSAGSVKPKPWHGSTDGELERTVEDRRRSNKLCTSEDKEEETSRKEKKQGLCLTFPSKAEDTQTNRKEDTTQIRHSPLLHFSTSHLKDNVSPSQCSSSSSSSSPPPCSGCVPVIRHSSRAAMLQLEEEAPMPPYHLVSQASAGSSRAPYSRSGSTDSDNIDEGITSTHGNLHGAQNQAYINNKDPIGAQSWDYKETSDQSDTLKQDYNISNTYHLTGQNSEQMNITDPNDPHCVSVNKKYIKRIRDDSQNMDCSNFTRGLKYKMYDTFEDFPSKHQRMDCFDYQNVWMANAAEEQSIQSQDLRNNVPLPVLDSDTGSDSLWEDVCTQEDVKEEHSQEECETVNRNTAKMDKRYNVLQLVSRTHQSCLDDVTGGLSSFDCLTSVEPENMPGIDIKEPPFTLTMPAAHNMSDPTYSVVGPSYRGHLEYHCLPEEERHLSHQYSARKHSHHHSYPSSDEEEAGTFASQGYRSLRQHFATRTTDQILLLDISAKPAEFLFANALRQKETFGNGFRKNNREQLSEATSVAGVDSKYWAGETSVKKSKSVGKDRSRPKIEVIHKSAVEKRVSKHKDGDNKTPAMTICSPPNGQDSMSSILSVCIPSSRSASMPTTISARVSNPVQHPFQCSLCERSFSQRGSLNRHVRSHLGVRPFPCPRCPMTFSRQYRVTEHMRVHQRCVILSDF